MLDWSDYKSYYIFFIIANWGSQCSDSQCMWVMNVTWGCWCLSSGCCGQNMLVMFGSNFAGRPKWVYRFEVCVISNGCLNKSTQWEETTTSGSTLLPVTGAKGSQDQSVQSVIEMTQFVYYPRLGLGMMHLLRYSWGTKQCTQTMNSYSYKRLSGSQSSW